MSQAILLASASPRRRELLASLGLSVVVQPTDVPEHLLDGEAPSTYVVRVARAKLSHALAHRPLGSPAYVLAADTIVESEGRVLGKPQDAHQALEFLTALSGRSHSVRTAFAIGHLDSIVHTAMVTTEVTFRVLQSAEMDAYIASGEPFDKAGGYGIQSGAAGFVRAIHGSYTNVVGLPLAEVTEALRALMNGPPT